MYRAIITGLGGRGLHWIRAARQQENCAIVAYVEPFEPNRLRAIEKAEVPADKIFETLEKAAIETEADFVIDVTPPAAHRTIAETAFAANLHVFGEKPLSDNFDDAAAVVEAGRIAGLKHMITQNYRFGGQPRTTRRLLTEGLIGKPGQCDVRFYIPWADAPGSHYVEQPFMLLNDMMVHHFDMLRYVLGVDPVQVHAITWNQPWGWHKGDAAQSIVFQFPDNLMATHIACGCAVGSQTGWNGDWRIEGPNGSIDWRKDGMTYSHLHRVSDGGERKTEEIPSDLVSPSEQAMLTEFFAAIAEDRDPECSATDNLRSLAMVFAAIRSSEENRWVELREFL